MSFEQLLYPRPYNHHDSRGGLRCALRISTDECVFSGLPKKRNERVEGDVEEDSKKILTRTVFMVLSRIYFIFATHSTDVSFSAVL